MSTPTTMNAKRGCINRVEGLRMMHIGHAMRVCSGIVHLCPVQELNRDHQHRQMGASNELIGAIMSSPTTMNAKRGCVNRVEGLRMMHIGHAMRVCGGIVHLCPVQKLNRDHQHRHIGAPNELIGAIMSTPTTTIGALFALYSACF